MTDWSMWSNPTATILGGLKAGVSAASAADDDDALKAYAANPSDPVAQQKLLARNPALFTQISDAQTAQLKAKKALLDSQQSATVDAARRAVVAAHPEWFGGTANPKPASFSSLVTPSPASANISRPAAAALVAATPPASSTTSSLLANLNNPVASPGAGPLPTGNAALLSAPGSMSAAPPSGISSNATALINLASPAPSPNQSSGAAGVGATGLAALSGAAASSVPPPAPASGDPAGNDIVVMGKRTKQGPDISDLAMIDPDEASKLLLMRTHVAALGAADRKTLDAKTETWIALYPQLAKVPYEQRQAIVDASRPMLRDHGFTDQEIDAFDPTDGNLSAERNLALGYKGVLSQQNSDRQYGEEVRSHHASEASAAQGHAIAIRGQNMADARSREANTVAQTSQNLQAIDYYADALRTGMPIPSFGSGRQAAAMRTAIATRAAGKDVAEGKTGADLAAARARYAGFTASERTVGTRTANIDLAANEAGNVIPLARAASDSLSRSGFLPLARVQQLIQNGNNDPRLRTFVTANNAVVNTYARAISPTGVPHVTDQEHARQMLSTAFDQPSYNAVLNQMQREIGAARNATGQVRSSLDTAITGRAPATGPTARNPRTGQRVQLVGARWVPVQ